MRYRGHRGAAGSSECPCGTFKKSHRETESVLNHKDFRLSGLQERPRFEWWFTRSRESLSSVRQQSPRPGDDGRQHRRPTFSRIQDASDCRSLSHLRTLPTTCTHDCDILSSEDAMTPESREGAGHCRRAKDFGKSTCERRLGS